MANLTLTIKYTGAALEDDPTGETARLLCEAAGKVEAGYHAGTLRDVNGNQVGHWAMEPGYGDPSCPYCGDRLTDDVEADGRPSYCPTCDREVG